MSIKNILLSIFVVTASLNAHSALAATSVTGSIVTDTTWDSTGSPYQISGNVVLYPGYSLTIEPGVTVELAAGADLDIRGHLQIDGNSSDPVTITGSVDPTTNWTGAGFDDIRINSDLGGTLTANYLHISHLHTAIQVDCCYASGLEFAINNSTFSDNTVGIFGYDGPSNIMVDSTTFQNNTYAIKGTDVSVTNSTFTGNNYGLHYTSGVSASCSSFSGNIQAMSNTSNGSLTYSNLISNTIALDDPWSSFSIDHNTITDNDTGLYIESSGTDFTDNNIYNNTTWNVNNGSSSNQTLTNNWWNTTVLTDIAATINDGLDSAGPGLVTVDPVLTTLVDTAAACVSADTTAPGNVVIGKVGKDPWNKTIILNWTNPSDADFNHVQIDRTDRAGNVVNLTTTETGTTYTDATIEYGEYYYYTLTAVDSAGNASTGVSTGVLRVRAPIVRHLALFGRDSTIYVRWERLPLRTDPAAGYILYYGTSADALTNVLDVGNSRMVTIPELVRGQQYYVAVAAYNSDGVEGPQSPIRSIVL